MLSVSLSGFIAYLDANNPAKPIRVIKVRLTFSPSLKQLRNYVRWIIQVL